VQQAALAAHTAQAQGKAFPGTGNAE
jgi:hypothetical protein